MGEITVVPDEESVWDIRKYIDDLDQRDLELEQFFLLCTDRDSLVHAVKYARMFFARKGWPELEEKIKDDPRLACFYARNVIKRRFPEGEEAIARDAWMSYLYAAYVIKGRFELGERALYGSMHAVPYRVLLNGELQ